MNLNGIYTRGGQNSTSTITGTKQISTIAPILRVSRLRHYEDLEAFLDEDSAVADIKSLLLFYKMATFELTQKLTCVVLDLHRHTIC